MRGFTGLGMAVLVAAGLNAVPAGSPHACENRPGCACPRHEDRQDPPSCHHQTPTTGEQNHGSSRECCCLRSAPFEAPATIAPATASQTHVRLDCFAALCGPVHGACCGPSPLALAPPQYHRGAVDRPRHIPLRC